MFSIQGHVLNLHDTSENEYSAKNYVRWTTMSGRENHIFENLQYAKTFFVLSFFWHCENFIVCKIRQDLNFHKTINVALSQHKQPNLN